LELEAGVGLQDTYASQSDPESTRSSSPSVS